MQTVLMEVEQILNNSPLTYTYPNDLESCLTPNHLLYGRNLPYQSEGSSPVVTNFDKHSITKITNILNHFWDRWRHEYVVNLRESHKSIKQHMHQPSPSIGDIVIIHENKLPRTVWRLGKIEQLHGKNNQFRRATVRTQTSRLTRPVNLLYPIEYVRHDSNERTQTDDVSTDDKELTDNDNATQLQRRPRRDAAIRGELRRQFFS